MAEYIDLDYWQVAFATLLIVINGIISVALRLHMEKSLVIASFRTIVQLLLVGLVLQSIFQLDRWYLVVGLGMLMTLIAGTTAATRNKRHFPGIRKNTILAIWASSWFVTAFALLTVFQDIDKWYQPQYAIPLLGMVLGNTLNGISVGLNTFTEELVAQRITIESMLAMGASRLEAAIPPIRSAVRAGLTPIINSMMIVGIVSLPGMMTGQLVAGMDPTQAVKYQIVIMFVIAGATAMGTIGVVFLSYLRLFTPNHQFRHELLRLSSRH